MYNVPTSTVKLTIVWQDLLQWADTDHDGDISLREYLRTKKPEFALQHQKQEYMSIDDNRDGRVTRYEFLRHVPPPEGVSEEQHVANTDTDGNGTTCKLLFPIDPLAGWFSFGEIFKGTLEPDWHPEPGHSVPGPEIANVKKVDTPTTLHIENNKLFKEIDLNKDGKVDHDEFIQVEHTNY